MLYSDILPYEKELAPIPRCNLLLVCEGWETIKAKKNEVIILTTLVKSLTVCCVQVV